MNVLLDSENDSLALSHKHLRNSLIFPVISVLVIWFAHLSRIFWGMDAADYGIIPRTMYGWWGIITAPLVHGSMAHIASNTVPLFVLSALTFYFYKRVAAKAVWFIYIFTGLLVWLFARPVSHIGASGVVYGLVAFLFWNGITRGSVRSIILSLAVLFFYSGMFVGILPNQEGVSWESHLLGSIAGITAAFWFKNQLEDEEVTAKDPFADERGMAPQLFLAQGTFEKTKTQRRIEAEEEARRAAEEILRLQQEYFLRQQPPPPPPFWNQSGTW